MSDTMVSQRITHHLACVEALRDMAVPLLSCWPVVTEAAWLLRRSPTVVQQLLGSVDDGFLELLPIAGSDSKAIANIMKRMRVSAPGLRMLRWYISPAASESRPSLPWNDAILLFIASGGIARFVYFRR
jgi:hypothetical protein